MNKPVTIPWIDMLVTCQFPLAQSMAEMSEKTRQTISLVQLLACNTSTHLYIFWCELTCYCEGFISCAVESKERRDHTEWILCSRLERWDRMWQNTAGLIRLKPQSFPINLEKVAPFFIYVHVPLQGNACHIAFSHADRSHRWRNWWQKERKTLYVIM